MEHFYITQIHQKYNNQIETHKVQQHFSKKLPNTNMMNTTKLDKHNKYHYTYKQNYHKLKNHYNNLIAHDIYKAGPNPNTKTIDVSKTKLNKNQIIIQTTNNTNTLVMDPKIKTFFEVQNNTQNITTVHTIKNKLILKLGTNKNPTNITFIGHPHSNP